MATYVLVHGAWHGGWCWRRVVDRLRAAGHDASAPTLTGLGERAHLLDRTVTLDTHIQDVVAHLACEDLRDVVLVGHSYGGLVITGAADRAADRVRGLVYVDAYVPDDGQSLLGEQLPERAQAFRDQVEAEGEGWRVPPRSAAFFGIDDPADRAWVDGLTTDQPFATFTQPIRLSGAHRRVANRTFVLAARYNPSAFHGIAARLRDDPSWRVAEIDTGHDVMVTEPEALSRLLLEVT